MPDDVLETVLRTGTFFELGDYPDKQFSLTEAEADAALAAFVPVPLNIEHVPSIFDGKLGTVQRLWREGTRIVGEYGIPKWLHDVTGAIPLKLSAEWDRAKKLPVGAGLVLNPRVESAAIMAAFSNAAAVLGDAPPVPSANTVRIDTDTILMATAPDKQADGHDSPPAGYPTDRDQYGDPTNYKYPLDTADHVRAAWAYIHRAGDSAVYDADGLEFIKGRISAAAKRFNVELAAGKGNTKMSIFNRMAALFAQAAEQETADGGEARPAPTTAPTAPVAQAPNTEIARMSAEIAELRAARASESAQAWADGEIRACRALPAERELMVAMFMQAARDDQEGAPATVTFASTTITDRVSALRTVYTLRSPHNLLRELVPGADFKPEDMAVLMSRRQAPTADEALRTPPTAERLKYLKGLTPLGQADLESRSAANGK